MIIKQPSGTSVRTSDAINDEALVSAALEVFAGSSGGGGGDVDDDSSTTSNASLQRRGREAPVTTGVAGVIKSPLNHVVSE